jgi:rare lipoprotein A
MVRVTNQNNGREVDVKINDRGPFVEGRVIDLSLRAARQIDLVRPGVAPVKLKILAASSPAKPAYGVQVGAFENQRAAEDLMQRLEKKYHSVSVQAFTGDKTLYRVRVGSEPDVQAAEKLASQLKKDQLKVFIVRLD